MTTQFLLVSGGLVVCLLQASVVEGIRGTIQGDGLLIHPDLFVLIAFRLFC
jgi:hypothetical protein